MAESLATEATESIKLEEDVAVGRSGEGSLDVRVDESAVRGRLPSTIGAEVKEQGGDGQVSGVELASDLASDHVEPAERDPDEVGTETNEMRD